MKIFFRRRERKRKGFTLVEFVLALVLSVMVMGIAVSAVNLLSKGYVGTNMETTVAREDASFIFKINENIKNAATAFTMPETTFHMRNLTSRWDYLGIMENVKIDKSVSRTGKEIESARAFVYAQYYGETMPVAVPKGSFVKPSSDGTGWFIVSVLGHDFVDTNGMKHEYSLVFEPVIEGKNAKEIKYKFTSTIKDENGKIIGNDKGFDADVDTMLTSLNSLQIVYRGGSGNPATALAFCNEVLPSTSSKATSYSKGITLVTLILDYSDSMTQAFGEKSRVEHVKDNVEKLIDSLSNKGRIYLSIVPFSTYAMSAPCYPDGFSSKEHLFALSNLDEFKRAKEVARAILPNGTTNAGDGVRVALKYMRDFEKKIKAEDPAIKVNNMLVMMTDGNMNSLSWDKSKKVYDGDEEFPPYAGLPLLLGDYEFLTDVPRSEKEKREIDVVIHNLEMITAQDYMRRWATKMKTEYPDLDTYLISLSENVSESDKQALMEAFNTTKQFDANTAAELSEAFSNITSNIGENVWVFEGPGMME